MDSFLKSMGGGLLSQQDIMRMAYPGPQATQDMAQEQQLESLKQDLEQEAELGKRASKIRKAIKSFEELEQLSREAQQSQ